MPRAITLIAALSLSVAMLFATSSTASAHERRMVGQYQLLVGWLNEPALQGEPNAASVQVTDAGGKPVDGLEKTLKIAVTAGGLTNAFTGEVRAVEETRGLYALDLIPTATGSYTFTITGKVGLVDVNEKFESGPGRFDDVVSQVDVQYPSKVPAGADLAARLDDLQSTAARAQLIATVGLVVAIVLPIALLTLTRRSRS
jgi:hypothetical protein